MRETRSILRELAFLSVLAAIAAAFTPDDLSGPDPRPSAVHADADALDPGIVGWFRLHSPALTDVEVAEAARSVAREARRHGLDAELILAVIQVESGGDAFACSSAGAVGLMQLRPRTAEHTARRLGVDWRGAASLADPAVNIRLGVAYLRELIDRFGNVEAALAAYNMGPSRVASRLADGAPVPRSYPRRVKEAFGGPLDRGARLL
jgi:soluble lytic murein transglycosylase-like protein